MIAYDDGRWPLVVATVRGRFTATDAAAHVAAFDAIFRRREPFVVLVVYADEAAATTPREPAADAILAGWLRLHRSRFAGWCGGLALAVPRPTVWDRLAPAVADVGPSFGEPFALFGSPLAAEAWAADRLAALAAGVPYPIPVDPAPGWADHGEEPTWRRADGRQA